MKLRISLAFIWPPWIVKTTEQYGTALEKRTGGSRCDFSSSGVMGEAHS